MPLKLSLGPRERVIIGNALISNGDIKCEIVIENRVPVLRGKHVMSQREATTPCREVYFALQLMYLENQTNPELQGQVLGLISKIGAAAPSTIPVLSKICDELAAGRHYSALSSAQELISTEARLLDMACNKSGALRPPTVE